MNNIVFIIIVLLIMLYVFIDIKKQRLTIKESFWWYVILIIMLLLSIFPYSIDTIASWFGIAYPPALLFIMCLIFLLLQNYNQSKRISNLEQKTTILEQELAIKNIKKSKSKKI